MLVLKLPLQPVMLGHAALTLASKTLAVVPRLVLGSELDMGRVHPRVGSGRVGSGRDQIFSLLSGLGRVGSIIEWVCVGHPGSYKMLR